MAGIKIVERLCYLRVRDVGIRNTAWSDRGKAIHEHIRIQRKRLLSTIFI